MGIAGLIIGIFGAVFCWVPWLGLSLGVIGLIFSVVGKSRRSHPGPAIGGLVCSIVALVVGSIFTIITIGACIASV